MEKPERISRWVVAGSCFMAMLGISYAVVRYVYVTKKSPQIVRNRYNPEVISKPLPASRLVDLSGKMLSDDELRRGRVFLVLLSADCDACLKEGRFLESIIEKYKDLRFYGALVFWQDRSVSHLEGKFPANLKLFFDEDFIMVKALEVRSVPLKIYLEDGIIKKIWSGAVPDSQAEGKFLKELGEISNRQGEEE
jgi:hypothetical protein